MPDIRVALSFSHYTIDSEWFNSPGVHGELVVIIIRLSTRPRVAAWNLLPSMFNIKYLINLENQFEYENMSFLYPHSS